MVGLVSPDMIARIGSFEKLREFLVNCKITHVATLRNWFEIVNQTPIFKTEEREPEIMEVFAFDPQRTRFTPQDVSRATVAAAQYLYQGQYNLAGEALQRAVNLDPQNAKVHHLIGSLLLATGRHDDATRELHVALRLHPELLESWIGLAQVAARQNKPAEAVAQLETLVQEHPNYATAYRALADIYSVFKMDTVRAQAYMQRFNELRRAHQ
jgi:predicted Zn-dependent protease